jgi:hypothetical protein
MKIIRLRHALIQSRVLGHLIRPAATFSPSDAEKGARRRGSCRTGHRRA